jgi:DNA (cytosine-5)-methyltransferase 1
MSVIKEKTFIEFFAGIGLVRLGLEAAGWRSQFANDIDPKKFEMYQVNFDDAVETYRLGDIHELNADHISRATLAHASFPCTDLSLAGGRRGLAGDQSATFWAFTKLLEEMDGQRPPLIMIENVTGFVTSHQGQDFAEALAELNRIGYAVDAFVLDAINFVPQSRPRLFVIGVFDAPRTKDVSKSLKARDSHLLWSRLTDFMTSHSQISWSLLDLPKPPSDSQQLSEIIESIPDDSSRWWSSDRVYYLLDQMSLRHKAVVDRLALSPGEHYMTVYRRVRAGKSMAEVRADGIAGCLRTPRGGSSRQILLVAGDKKIRARFLTPREYARLMGVPEGYKIQVADNQAYFGFGDAVCVPAIQWIAENVLDPLLAQEALSGTATIAES